MRQSLLFGTKPVAETKGTYGDFETDQFLAWMKANPEAVEQVRAEAECNKKNRALYAALKELTKQITGFEEGFDIPTDCADAVVLQNNHVLLVKRKHAPGKGLYALPGGHIQKETALDAAIRELKEETRLNVPTNLLRDRMVDRKVFDHPERSERGWVRTEAFRFDLTSGRKMEKVKGQDDAEKAIWMPINRIRPDILFEDHFDIIQTMVPGVPFAYSSVLMTETH